MSMQSKADRSLKWISVGSLLLLMLILGKSQAASTRSIIFVQVAAATPQAPTSSVTLTYPHTQTAGNLNVVVVGWNDTNSTVQSVKDSLGNTYNLAVGPTKGTALSQSIYYAKNIVGGSNKVTVTFSQAASSPDIRVLEYAGADATNPLDVTAAASGSGSTTNSGSATTRVANELIFGANTVFTGNSGPGATFTERIITSPDADLAEDKTVSSIGSYNTSAPLGSSGPWVMQMATFKLATGSASSAPTVTSLLPNSGSVNGGTAVTVTGTNFVSGATVTFGGISATNVSVVSSTSITATTPAHAAGAVKVVVNNSNGQSGTLTNGYNYTSTSTVSTINFVQVAAATPQSPTSTVTVSYPLAQTAGDLNIIVVGWNDTSATVQSVTDSLGNTYALAVGPTKGTALTQSIYYAKNIATGTNTVTVTFSQGAASPDIRILEYSGLDTANPLDAMAGTSGNSASANSGSATTNFASELIFGANTVFTGNEGAGTGFVARIITSPDSDLAEDQIVTATGSYSATAPLGASGPWVMQMVGLKASGSSGTGGLVPSVSSVSPSSGSSSGGSAVIITGSNFVAGATVSFGGTAASNVTVLNSTSITATTPAHAAGAVNVVVNDSNGSGTLTNGFSYTTTTIQHTVVLSWKASSSANVTSYNVYRSTVSGGYYGLIGSTAGSLSYTDNTVASGTTYYYVTTAVNNQGQQSEYSNQVVATVPSP